jgi:hypothetical protein
MLRAPSTVLFLSWAVLLSLLLASVSAEDEDLLTERAPPLNLQTPHQRMYVPFMHPIQQRTFEFMPHTVDVCRLARMGRIQGSLQVAVADLETKKQDMRKKVARAEELKRAKARLAEKAKTEKREVLQAQLAEAREPCYPSGCPQMPLEPARLNSSHGLSQCSL